MKTLSENLTRLIVLAEDIIRKPAELQALARPSDFGELAAELRRADEGPCDGPRCTFAGVIVCKAIEAFFSGQWHYQSTIGNELPQLRREAFQARNNERAAAEETRR